MMAWLKLIILSTTLLLLLAIENDAAGHQTRPSGHIKTLGSRGNEPIADRDSSDTSYVEYVQGGPLGSLYDFLISNRLQRFCKLLRNANVDDLLVEMGIFTIFAPNDGSFAFLPGGILEQLEKDQRLLREFVLYHIVEGDLQTTSITNDLVVESLQRIPIRFNIYDNAITVSGAEILERDLKFDIGRVHIIDRPLYPYAKTDILSYLKENHFEFYQLIVRAGLSDYISSGTFSIFVPDDKSFDYLSIDLKDALRLNESLAYRVVLNHILPGAFFVRGLNAGAKRQAVAGEDFIFTQRRGLTFVNGFPILQSDIPVTNGVIHVINRAILPEGIDSDCHCKPLDTSHPSGTGTQRPGPGRSTTRRPIQTNDITSSPGKRPPPGSRPSPGSRPLPDPFTRPTIPPVPGQTLRPRPGSRPLPDPFTRPTIPPGPGRTPRPRPGSRPLPDPFTRPTIPPGSVQTPRPRPGSRPSIPIFDEVKHGDKPSEGGDHGQIPPISDQRPGIRPVPGVSDVSNCRPLGERPIIGDRRPLCPGLGITPTTIYPRPTGAQFPGTPFRPGTGSQVTPPPGVKAPTVSVDIQDCRLPGEHPRTGDRRPLCPHCRSPGDRAIPGDSRPLCQMDETPISDCRRPGEHIIPGDRRPLCAESPSQNCRSPGERVIPGDRRTLCPPGTTPTSGCRAPGERATPGDRRPVCPQEDVDITQDCRLPGERAQPGDRRPLCPRDPNQNCRAPGEYASPGDRRPVCPPGTTQTSGCRAPGERAIPGDRRPICPQDIDTTSDCRRPGQRAQPGDQRPLCPGDPSQNCRAPGEHASPGDRRPVCPPDTTPTSYCRAPGERAIPGDRRPICPQDIDTTSDCRLPGERAQPGERRPLCPGDPNQNCRAPGEHANPGDRRPVCPVGTLPTSGCRAPGEQAIPGDRRPFCSQDMDTKPDCRLPGERVQPGDRRPLCAMDPNQSCRAPGEHASPGDRRPICPPGTTSTSGCRAPGERAIPGDRRPICPQDIDTTSDCRLPGERAQPGDRRPLCPEDPNQNCRAPGEHASPGDRRPVCPPGTTPTSGCRAPGERAIPGDRRPICPQDIDTNSDCRLPGERAQPGDRRPLCPEDPNQNCRAPGEHASPGDRRPLCPPGITPTTGCRAPGERSIPGDRRPLCSEDIDAKPDCRLPGERVQPGDRRPLCPRDPNQNCRSPGEHASPGDRRPVCPPGTAPTSGCRAPGERAIPGDRRPICPQDIDTTSDCRLPGKQAQPGDRRPLCPGDPNQNCRAPGEHASPGDRRPVCPTGTTPTSGCRAPGERAIPGDRRPLCSDDIDTTSYCRLPGKQVQPGDRRPLCPGDPNQNCRAPGEHASPGDRRPVCPPGTTPTSGCRAPGERAIPGDRRPICPQDIDTTSDCRLPGERAQPGDRRPLCPEDPNQNCRAPGEHASPGDRRPVCPPGTTPTSGCRAPGERAIPGDRRPICPQDIDTTSDCRLPGERAQPGDRRPLCPEDPNQNCRAPGEHASPGDRRPVCSPGTTPTSGCRTPGERAIPGDRRPFCQLTIQPVPDCRQSSERATPGDRRPMCPTDQISLTNCRNPGDNSIHGDTRPFCASGITSIPDCRTSGERFAPGDNRPLCPRETVRNCRMPAEVFTPGDRRPQCPPSGLGTVSSIGPTRGPFTHRPTVPQPPGSVSLPYPGSQPGPQTRRPDHSTRFPGQPDDNSVDGFTDYYPEDYEPSVQRPGQPPRLHPPSQIPGRVPRPPSREQTPNQISDQPGPRQPSWRQTSSQRPVRPTQASRRTTISSRTPSYPSGPGEIPGHPGQRPGISSPSQFTTRTPVFPPRRSGGQTSHATKGQPYDPARHPPQRRPTGRFPSLPSPPAQNLSPTTGGRPTRSQIRGSPSSSSPGSPSWTQTSIRRTHQTNRQTISNCRRRGDRITPETQSLPLCLTNEKNRPHCQHADQPYDPTDPRPVCESNVDEDFYSICRNPEAPFDPADTRPVCANIRDQATCRPPGQPFNPTDNRPLCKANVHVPLQPSDLTSYQPQGENLSERNMFIDRTTGQHERRTNQQAGHPLSPPGQVTRDKQFNQGTRNRPYGSQPFDSSGQRPSSGISLAVSQQSGLPVTLENQHPTQPSNYPLGNSGERRGETSAPSSSNQPDNQQQGHGNTNPRRTSPTFPASTPSADTGTTTVGDDSPRSLYEIVEEPALLIRGHPVQLTRIFKLFQKAGLEHILSDPGPHTIFLPSDDAFHRLPQGVIEQLEQNPELLRQVLLYHITTSQVLPAGVDESYSVPSLQGNQLLVTMVNGGRLVLISGSKAVAVTKASNGIFYVINQFLYPLPQDDIVSALHSRPDLSQATTFTELSGMQDLLQGDKPYTMFAPTDNAFNQLPEAVIQELTQNVTALRQLLMGHLIEGAHYGREFLTGATYSNLAGGRLNLKVVSFGYQVNDVNIKSPEIITGTGVIHVIDEVLISPEIQLLMDKLQNSIEGTSSPESTKPNSRTGNTAGRTHSILSAGHRQNSMSYSGRPGSQTVQPTSNTYTSSRESTFTQNGPITSGYGSTTTRQGSSFTGQGFTSLSQHGASVTRQGFGQGSPSSGHGFVPNLPESRGPGITSSQYGTSVTSQGFGQGSSLSGHESIPSSPGSVRPGHGLSVSSHGSNPDSPGSQESGFTFSQHGTPVTRQGFGQGSSVSSYRSSSSGTQGSGFSPRISGPQVPGHGSTYNLPDVSRQGTLYSGSLYPLAHRPESNSYGSDVSRHGFTSGDHESLPGASFSGGDGSLPSEHDSPEPGHRSNNSNESSFQGHGIPSSSPEHYSGVAQQASTIGLSRFASLITSTGISDKIADGGTYTVFAPTDAALNSLGSIDSNQLKIVLLYHILPQKLGSRSVQNDETASTLLEGKRIRFNVYRGGHMMTALGVPIVQPNNVSSSVNLVPVDHVLMPPEGDLMKVMESLPNLQVFTKAVKDSHLGWMLSGEGSWTLFAPSDKALQALSEEDRKNMLGNRQNFTDFLKSHLLRGTLFTSGLENGTQKQTENRKSVTFTVQDGGVAINSVPISYSDVPATNGVLHIIDQCL